MKNFIFFASIFLLIGCNAYQYIPSPEYVPLNKEKGDININLSARSVSVGYAITDHLSVFTNGFYNNMSRKKTVIGLHNTDEINKWKTKQFDINVGASWFTHPNLLIYEVLGGVGYGQIEYQNIYYYTSHYQLDMQSDKVNLFIQPSVGYHHDEIFEVGVFTRFFCTRYINMSSTIDPNANGGILFTDKKDAIFLNNNNVLLLFAEPGLVIKAGIKHVKFTATFAPCLNLTNQKVLYKQANLYAGLLIDLNVFKK